MKVFQMLAKALVVSALAASPALAQMADTSDQADMQVTADTRQQLIANLSNQINESYVFPDIAKMVSARLLKQHQRGAYDKITSAQQLSEILTKELQAASNDRHLRVMYSAKAIPATKLNSEPTPIEVANKLAVMRSNNFGVEKIERLPLNIGYLDLHGFAPAREAAETLSAAMTVLAHTDALIIDMRNNFGGQAATSTLLASYLLDKRTHLGDFYYREGNRIEQRWSSDVVPGLHYGSKRDVYILTSKDTFSAGEDFTYALKNLGRAIVVGETTGGGANAGDNKRLHPHFSAFIPLSRLISPITKTNWEGVGVRPDISVGADSALNIAQVAILTKMANAQPPAGTLALINDRIAELRKENPVGVK